MHYRAPTLFPLKQTTLISAVVVMIASSAYAGPKAVVDTETLDFGRLKRGDVGTLSIPIRNDGDAPFEITQVNASCPCVIVEQPPRDAATIAPGKTYELPVRYDTKDRVGPQGAVIAILTNDPENPAFTVDVTAFVEALVVVRPPNGVVWGLAPRGKEISRHLEFAPGDIKSDIELLELRVTHPGVKVATAKSERNGEKIVTARFSLAPDVPLGTLDAKVEARLRVGEEEAAVTAPFHGDVIGDIIVSPPSIISPKTAYALGQRISEITVRSSEEGNAPPKLLGTMAVGDVKAVILKTIDPASHRIAVHAGDQAGEGPQSGTVYVMTDSVDQPVTAVPVYFRMGASVRVEPATVVLAPGASQQVNLRPNTGDRLKVLNIGFEEDVVRTEVSTAETTSPDTPAVLTISAVSNPKPDRLSSIVVVETDVPGGSRVYIPVVVTPN